MLTEQSLPIKRCAIYTRKSTTQRLAHDVNSLVTQREICSAYIKSQQYKGWVELPQHYDDGGHSGSGLERPALSRLMQDVEAGEVDAVVVYKIDRLTRSLLDFVRLVELFDRQSITLVSISQAFDTSDSMGRMILNVLLTFSQFERELIAERVRDSIRTRKRHGRIHGGLPPFGYVAGKDGLRVDEAEARIVRFIFAEFLRTRRYTSVMTAVREAGYCSSVKLSRELGDRRRRGVFRLFRMRGRCGCRIAHCSDPPFVPTMKAIVLLPGPRTGLTIVTASVSAGAMSRSAMDRVGLRRSAIYQRMSEGRFPKCRTLGPKCSVWVETEINEWVRSVAENKS